MVCIEMPERDRSHSYFDTRDIILKIVQISLKSVFTTTRHGHLWWCLESLSLSKD